ncbi:MAG: spore coat U domain-containing protein [Myxococcales bacterium]
MRLVTIAAALCLFAPAAARAAACQQITATLAFGPTAYDVYSAADTTQAGTVTYKCPPPLSPVVSLSASANGAYRPRQMTSGGNTLNYEIYFDPAMTSVWGVGADSRSVASAGGTTTVQMYGRIFAQQDAAVGAYSDTITVTFNF